MPSMDLEGIQQLHEAIGKGDFELVRRLLQSQDAGQYFALEGTSALFKAFSCEEYEIASHLIHKSAKIADSEVYDLDELGIDLTRINYHLTEYNKKSEKACIHYLISLSQSPQGFDGKHVQAVMKMYELFFSSEILRSLMDVVRFEVFDLIYDFESEDVNKIYRLEEEGSEIYGLTITTSKEIFIGAKDLLSDDPQRRGKVYGVLAEELCHLAMTALFENDAKPYRKVDSDLVQKFNDIVEAVESFTESSSHTESVIKHVFKNYYRSDWECELIARVPHVLGIYGEELGREKLTESSALSRLLSFYENNVLPKCKIYADPSLNTTAHRVMEQLTKKEFISFQEKQIRPLEDNFPSFREYLVDEEGIDLIITNCPKLCVLHVYHELREEYQIQLERKCLFFSRKRLEMKRDDILNALKANVWEYVIVILDERKLNLKRFRDEYLDHFIGSKNKDPKIILISGYQSLDQKFQTKNLNYEWDDLTDHYKYFRASDVTYVFKGMMESIQVKMDNVLEDFTQEEIMKIMSGGNLEVNCSDELDSYGYSSETYIERNFQVITVDKNIFQNLPPDVSVYISGMSEEDFQKMSIDEKLVQWQKGSNDAILENKPIFIVNYKRPITFNIFAMKSPKKINLWLHYDRTEFILRSDSSDDAIKGFFTPRILTEEDMLKFLERERVVIISDNAGYGKSTVVSSLIRHVNEMDGHSWSVRVDLGQVSCNEISLTHNVKEISEDEVLGEVLLMLGLKKGVNKYHFRYNSKFCFIFLDAFDEMPSKFKAKVLELISFLREKTSAKIFVTSRKDLQEELEETLNTYSYELVPFHREVRLRYLGLLWKFKLKYPHEEGRNTSHEDKKAVLTKIKNIIEELKKEITNLNPEYLELLQALEKIDHRKSLAVLRSDVDKLDFIKIAENILEKNFMDEETLGFIGIPLHLFMIGTIYYSRQFNVQTQSNFYSLYSDFIEQKIQIYLEQKEELKEGRLKDRIRVKVTEDTYRIHKKLSDQIITKGKACLSSVMDEQDRELSSAIGIVYFRGGDVHFLHQTFAEFFFAESLSQNLQKEALSEILFKSEHKVIRRFLAHVLEKKKFGNLNKETLSDLHFLFYLMDMISKNILINPKRDVTLDEICIFKIMKILLENFEGIVERDLIDKLLYNIEIRIEYRSFNVGGFLSVNMVRNLMKRNFEANSIIILTFLRFSENFEEVKHILEEWFSMADNVEVKAGFIEEGNENEGMSEKYFLRLLRLKDSDGYGLFIYAVGNQRIDVFAYLINFLREYFEKYQFPKLQTSENDLKEILLGSDKDGDNIIHFLVRKDSIKFLKQYLELFKKILGNGIWLKELLKSRDQFSMNIFQIELNEGRDINNLLRYCDTHLEKEDIKEVLLRSDDFGDNFIHRLVRKASPELLLSSLEVFKEVLGDGVMLKQLLQSKNRLSENIFQLYLSAHKNVDDLLRFCVVHLETYEIKDMLLSSNNEGNNIIHLSARYSSSEVLLKNLEIFKDVLGDEALFKQLLKSKNRYSRNVFQLCLPNHKNMDSLLRFCADHLEIEEIEEMILSSDKDGNNIIYLLATYSSSENFLKHLELFKEVSGDETWFKQLLKSKNQYSRNIFQLCLSNYKNLGSLLRFCADHLKVEEIKEIILSSDEEGNNIIHFLVLFATSEHFEKNLELLKEIIGDRRCFKQLLKSKGKHSRNILQLAWIWVRNIKELHRFCGFHLEKDEILEMLLDVDEFGDNVIHFLITKSPSELFLKNLEFLKENLGDRLWLKKLLKSKNRNSMNIFQLALIHNKNLNELLKFSAVHLEKDEIKEMLISLDAHGNNVMCYLDYHSSSQLLMKNLEHFKEVLGDGVWLKKILTSTARYSRNIFHLTFFRGKNINELLTVCHAHLEEEEIKEMLLSSDENGDNPIHFLVNNYDTDSILKNLGIFEEILGDSVRFKQLVKSKGRYSRNIFHLALCKRRNMSAIINFCATHLEKDEIKEMLLSYDVGGNNVINFSNSNETFKIPEEDLKLINHLLGEDE